MSQQKQNKLSALKSILLSALCFASCLFPIAQAGTITYLHNDALGSAVAATNEQGDVLWQEAYRPYGERIRKEVSNNTHNVWFTGKPEEATFGLSYFGARWYDPKVGRFMAVDPVGFKEGNIQSFNRYAYANGNPYKFVDPDGRSPDMLMAFNPQFVASVYADTMGVDINTRKGANAVGERWQQEGIIQGVSTAIMAAPGAAAACGTSGVCSSTLVGHEIASGGVVKNAKKGDIYSSGGKQRAKKLFREFDTKGVGNRKKVRDKDGTRAVDGQLGDGTPLRIRFKSNGTTRLQAGKTKIQFND